MCVLPALQLLTQEAVTMAKSELLSDLDGLPSYITSTKSNI